MIRLDRDKLQNLIICSYPVFCIALGHNAIKSMLPSHLVKFMYLAVGLITCLWFIILFTPGFKNKLYKINPIFFKINMVVGAIIILGYDIIQYRHFKDFGYIKPNLMYYLDIIMLIITLFMLIKDYNFKFLLTIVIIFSILHLYLSIHYFPLTIERSDMLAAIHNAITNFLNGNSPYIKTAPNVGIIPYLPLTWLFFIPCYLLHIDLRFTGIISLAIIGLILLLGSRKLDIYNKQLILLFFINPSLMLHHELYFWLFMIEITVFYCFYKQFPWLLNSLIIGLIVTTWQFGWIISPFLALQICRNKKQLFGTIILSILIFIVISYCSINHDWIDYIHSIFLHQEFNSTYNSDMVFSISPIFIFSANQLPIMSIQIIITLSLILYSLIHWIYITNTKQAFQIQTNRFNYLVISGYAFIIFIATSYFIDKYFYIPVMLLIALI